MKSAQPVFDHLLAPPLKVNQQVLDQVAKMVTNRQISRGAEAYSRERDLPKLLGKDCLSLDRTTIIAALQNHLRAAKESIRKDHWTASAARCMAIQMALRAEQGYGRAI